MSGLRSPVRRQFGGILVSRALGSAFQALALILLARSVTPAVFGVVNVVIAVVGFVLVVTGLGMSIFVPWARARGEHDDVARALQVNSWSNAASALLLVPVLAAWAASSGQPVAVALIGLSLALERNVDTWLGVPIADGESRVAVVSILLRRTLTLAVLVPTLLLGGDPVLGLTAGLTLGAVAGQVHVRVQVGRPAGEARPRRVGSVVARAVPFLVSNATGQARSLDVSVVAAVAGPAAAGVYAAVTKLVQPILLVPQALGTVLVPHATRLDAAGARRLGGRAALACLAALVVASPLVVWREEVVVLVLGPQYRGAGTTFAVALGAVVLIAWAMTIGAVLQGRGRQRLVAWFGTGAALLTLLGVALGARWGGPTGAAAGLALSWLLYAVALAAVLGSPARGEQGLSTDPPG